MAVRPPRFTTIPTIPQQGLNDWQFLTLNAMKENIDLLTGARTAAQSASAIKRGDITVTSAPTQTMQQVTARGAGYTVSGVVVPSIEDYAALVTDVQKLANDVASLRSTVNALIAQLKG